MRFSFLFWPFCEHPLYRERLQEQGHFHWEMMGLKGGVSSLGVEGRNYGRGC